MEATKKGFDIKKFMMTSKEKYMFGAYGDAMLIVD